MTRNGQLQKQPTNQALHKHKWSTINWVWKMTSATVRAHLHQASASTLQQLCDDACNSVVNENNGVTPEWDSNQSSNDSTDFNENRIVSVIAALTLTLSVNGT